MSCDYKRTRITDCFVKVQSGDTYEETDAGDVVRLDSGFQSIATPEAVERDILKGSFTPTADMQGIKIASMTGVSEMYGADYSDGITKPWFDGLFRASQLVPSKIYSIPVSSISDVFVRGETITGDTSLAVGKVLVDTEQGDTSITISLTSGNFQAEDISGSIIGDATATGVEVDAGWSYKPNSNACERLSCRVEQDGQYSEMFNGVPTLSITCEDSKIPKINYEIAGVINAVNDVEQWMRDGDATEDIIRDQKLPALFQCARLKYNDFSPVVDSTLTLDMQIERPVRRNANSCLGVEGYVITGRDPILTYQIDTPSNVEADVMQNWFKSTDISNSWRFGKEQYNTFWFYGDSCRLQNVSVTDQDDVSKLELEFSLTGQDDEEIEIICI